MTHKVHEKLNPTKLPTIWNSELHDLWNTHHTFSFPFPSELPARYTHFSLPSTPRGTVLCHYNKCTFNTTTQSVHTIYARLLCNSI